jgi:hypothetical protein
MDAGDSDNFAQMMKWALAEIQGSSAYSLERNRPYDGQSHTDQGTRGKTAVAGLTMRDIADCMVRGFLDAAGIQRENPIRDDLYTIEEELDYGAVIQCAMCWIEKYMGIYPNVPELHCEE